MDESSPLMRKNGTRGSLTISSDKEKQPDLNNESKLQHALRPQKLMIVLCVLLVELCERMTYYGVVANLVLFCTSKLELSSNTATTISLVFSGTVYLIPLFGGYIADSWSNRFNVIYGSGLIYICGLFLILCSSIDYKSLFSGLQFDLSTDGRIISYMSGLALVAIGTGGIKANVGPFGAQQVQAFGVNAVQVFFNWFYWFINAGGLIAYCGIAYVQQNISFSWGFLIPFLSMMLSLIFLNVARNRYIYKPGQGSILGPVLRVCGQGFCKESPVVGGKRNMFDSARIQYGGSFDNYTVDGVIALVQIIPILFFMIMFWSDYSQMQTTYFLQGERMDLSVGSVIIPVSMLNAFNTVAVMITIPLLDRLVYPFFRRRGYPLTHLQRIGIGFVLSASSLFVAGGVEIERKKLLGFPQTIGDEQFYAANQSVFVQAPQFLLVGAGEAFTSIAGYEFVYLQAPKSMQGVVVGMFLVTNGLGSYLSSAIISIIEVSTSDDPWFPNDINNGKAEYVFFVFGGLSIVFLIGFIPVAYWYKYKDYIHDEEAEILAQNAKERQDHEQSKNRNTFL